MDDDLFIGGEKVKDTNELDFYNNLDLVSNKLHGLGTTAFFGSMLPIPYVQPVLKGAGWLLSTGGDVVDAFNGRVSIPGLIGRVGLNTAAVVLPSASSAKSVNALDKVGRGITKPFLSIKNPYLRYGAGVGAGLGITYLPEGAMNKTGDNVIIGAGKEFVDDLTHIGEGGPLDRAIKIASLPLFLRHPRAAKAATAIEETLGAEGALGAEEAAVGAEEAAVGAEEALGAGEALGGEESGIIVTGGGVPVDESGLSGGAALLAALAGTNYANAAPRYHSKPQKKQSKPKTVNGTYTGKPVDQSLMFTKSNKKNKTTTGTYTGKPSDNLLSGIIIGRKNGGKLNKLINLRK